MIIMYDQRIKLIGSSVSVNEYGDRQRTLSEREVFAELKSVGQTEFYQAHATGMKPELKFILPDYLEYNGEKLLKYRGYGAEEERTYNVIRTFKNGNELEITCAKGVE